MPTAYSPSGGRSKSTLARSSASGTWVRMPAPSPEFGSEPAAPRWSRLCSAVRPCGDDRRATGGPRASATKATPQASLSFAGSYSPAAAGTAENGHGRAVENGGTAAAGAVRSDMSLPSSAAVRTSERVPGGGWEGPGRWSRGGDDKAALRRAWLPGATYVRPGPGSSPPGR